MPGFYGSPPLRLLTALLVEGSLPFAARAL